MTQDRLNHYADEPHAASEPMPHHDVPYMKVFGALVVLTIITVAIGIFMRFENEAVNVLLALLIASTKASLVAMFFMHLKFEGKLILMIFLVPLALCVLLVVALLPDLLPIGDASLHLFNTPRLMQPHAEH
ncbi:MAG TPA: cytochrome C oxidase subunit IV family protein [Tepidisphaeraceae bacterium]|nr:cytochrome C oxidase subunit IV family protein [Tepidisphaeraceae bacterium]